MIRHPGCALRVRAKPGTWGNPARFDWALGGNYTSTQKRVILFSICIDVNNRVMVHDVNPVDLFNLPCITETYSALAPDMGKVYVVYKMLKWSPKIADAIIVEIETVYPVDNSASSAIDLAPLDGSPGQDLEDPDL